MEILDRDRWEAIHAAWPDREVFAHPAYIELFAGPSDCVIAAFAEHDRGWILYPFILRPLASGGADITTAYGYGGAYRHGSPPPTFWSEFDAWARGEGVVSEFVRFSLFDNILAPYPGEREERLVNIVCSLTAPVEQIWTEFDHKVRKNVNKARRTGVTVEVDLDGARLDEFVRIYEATMDRRDAKRGYYFTRSFFERITTTLPGQFAYFHAVLDGRIVSTELALVSARHVYSFLGGTDQMAFDHRPNDLLKHELILWAKAAGKQRFVLGGGYAPDDGIFRYKRAFAPNGTLPFSVGHRVLDPTRYAELVAAHVAEARAIDPAWLPDAGFFPAYRAPLPVKQAPA